MTVPVQIRKEVRDRIWARADELDWVVLPASQRAVQYELWTNDPEIGGVLSRYIATGKVRVYIKDTLLKDYIRTQLGDAKRPLRVLRIAANTPSTEEFIKPHGLVLDGGLVVCWARAADWRHVLMALHERTFGQKGRVPFGAVLLQANGKFADQAFRAMVRSAADKLGIENLVWLEV
ncbi:hypothetical protein JY651_30180 [Pyxidicoccus parkwayensis]|uniref:Uncharacterized protein n=1 Tax=Pyxidicoccus parkwayensis TaxID=2813578 RepID=A0ABX7NPS3_9BACT|nr:hypothetical protein [Pyxidicoccus parkwaysis]QSQ19570.1 hypothetical protein JY651_30180 [Pyxidicoccus parkwaysis]